MAIERIESFRARKAAATRLLAELIDTPLLVSLEFTVRMSMGEVDEAEYTVRRFIDPRPADQQEAEE